MANHTNNDMIRFVPETDEELMENITVLTVSKVQPAGQARPDVLFMSGFTARLLHYDDALKLRDRLIAWLGLPEEAAAAVQEGQEAREILQRYEPGGIKEDTWEAMKEQIRGMRLPEMQREINDIIAGRQTPPHKES